MEQFHFDFWMVSLVRWKPVLDANYPSKITFWVRVLDVPLQFWAASTFHGVGSAIGQVQGEVDLMEGRVRVQLDGFKPLVFSMEVDFDEGVELVVNLRYEKLFGFCKECFCMTHDQARCLSLITVVEEGSVLEGSMTEQRSLATSYKTAVTNGRGSGEIPREGTQVSTRDLKEGGKGKGIMREKQGSFRQEGAYRAYKDRFQRGYGEGSSRVRRQHGYGAPTEQQRRVVVNSRGL